MQNSIRLRIGVPASFAGVAIAILMAIFEVQGWTVPTPIAFTLIATLLVMIAVALGMIVYELVNAARGYLEHRATSASWVSSEAPGLLDYEADGLRATERFTKEMAGLARDTRNLGQNLKKHTQSLQNPKLRTNARLKQKRANQAAKSIDKSAVYIEKRHALMKALVKDISRNYGGLISAMGVEAEEDRAACRSLMDALAANIEVATTTIDQTTGYRDSVASVHDQNLSRTVRIASRRLVDGLEGVLTTLQQFTRNSRRLHESLEGKLRQASRSAPHAGARRPQPTS